MVQKLSCLVPSDRCGVWVVRVMHTYTKLSKLALTGHFLKVTIRITNPNNWLRRKKKTKSLFVRSFNLLRKYDGSRYKSNSNNVLLLKKRLTPRGRNVFGPINNNIKRKRGIASFLKII